MVHGGSHHPIQNPESNLVSLDGSQGDKRKQKEAGEGKEKRDGVSVE